MSFRSIAVIGAGTMGSGIAAQIANAGLPVLLLDLQADDNPNGIVEAAKQRLVQSDPPALLDKAALDLIQAGNMRDDFHKLAQCDWVVEAVVERLDIKRDLYRRLEATVGADCVVTSNTSTIPIKLLMAEMPDSFQRRFAITHYFNPVRYMRLLELVRGDQTAPDVIDRLAQFNDEIMGKGVVTCADTPGFLGNRVGVYALQVGMMQAYRCGLSVAQADALMGRPMGIPKTGVFGLYDLIGVDLMADVVDTLGDILPKKDVFHPVGRAQNPVMPLINQMIEKGFTGNKGLGGFYRGDAEMVDLHSCAVIARDMTLPPKAVAAAQAQQRGDETLHDLIAKQGEESHWRFTRAVLGHILAYAAHLIPDVTQNPQDIDDAMKLGFNWVRGPFEMIDALGVAVVGELIAELGLDMPMAITKSIATGAFYYAVDGVLQVRNFTPEPVLMPIKLPQGTVRFSMLRRTMKPLLSNASASLWVIGDNLRLIEFHSKANALTNASMEIVKAATKDHGRGIIVHNDAQHFSAGVDLNAFRTLIEAQDWNGIDGFLSDFQCAVHALKYTPVPVIGAPSGLSVGGGFEVLAHCDQLIAHVNCVLGLVETAVGVVPGGGGVKESYARWLAATGDPQKAAWETWMQIGYAKTGTSPQTSAKLLYYLPKRDQAVVNRDKLITQAIAQIDTMADAYQPPVSQSYDLPSNVLAEKMARFMDDGIEKGWFFAHDKTVAMAVASIVLSDNDKPTTVSEQDLYDRERRAFIALAKTPKTLARIASLLDDGQAIRN